jgi:putative CocE/NonD family hydrolase
MTVTRWIDRSVSRGLRLPAPTTGYRVHRGLPVPMRDGVTLRADHYAPDTDRPLGTILVRGPYGRAFPLSIIYARVYAARGYHVVFQSVRGTFGSGGEFVPMVHEADDAADTVAWLREQPWFTGTFGTIGLSYLGFTQWALLADPPPELVAAVVTVGPHDLHMSSWGSGAFALNDFLSWSDMVAKQETSSLNRLAFQLRARRRLTDAVSGVPLGEAGRSLLGHGSPWFESWVEHPDADDPFWERMRMTAALDKCAVPVLLLSGWQDVFVDQTIAQYRQLRDRGVDVAMTIGPWTHEQMMTKAASSTAMESLDWLGAHLAGNAGGQERSDSGIEPVPPRANPVRVYVTGRSRPGWVGLPDWPPATGEQLFHLHPGGRLGAEAPQPAAPPSVFRFDPAHPTPTVGGRLLTRDSGYREDTGLALRDDVLSFTSAALQAPLCVCGNPVVELAYETDNPHFDVFVRLSEVDAQGRSRNVSDGYGRFSSAPDGKIRLELDAVAHRFSTGSRLRVLVAGGCHPRFDRNLGTGEPAITGRTMRPSTHTVRHGDYSTLTLPVGEPGGVVSGV